jgi:heme a synthase
MDGHRAFRYTSILAFGMTYVTMLFGGNVIASGSGLACPDWPTCDGSLLGPLAGPAGIEWSHRLAALALGLVVLALGLLAVWFEARRPLLRTLALSALALTVLLAILGGLLIESQLSIAVLLLHFGLATVLFGILLVLAVLANVREIPRRWVEIAWRASEARAPPVEAPAIPPAPASRAPGPIAGARGIPLER